MNEHHEHIVVRDVEVEAVCDQIQDASEHARVCYDIETGSSQEMVDIFGDDSNFLPYAGSYITGFSVCVYRPDSWSLPLNGYYLPIGHERGNISAGSRERLARALGMTKGTHVGHNTPFDWAFLLNEGILYDVPRKSADTQIMRWLQDEEGVKKLKVLGEMWLGEDADAEKRALDDLMAAPYSKITDAVHAVLVAYPELGRALKNGKISTKTASEEARRIADQLKRKRAWGQLTPQELGIYGARDASLTAEIDHILLPANPASTVEREMKVNAICIDMTRKGVSADHDQLLYAASFYGAQEEALRAELLAVHGLENPNSSQQVADLLFNRLGLPVRGVTESGNASTDKNALEQLAGDPVAGKVLLARQCSKARTAYAEAFMKYGERSHDGRIHGMFGTTRTKTGRLAASNPNVMTIPRDESLPEIRRAFLLDPASGTERLGFDLASAELWVTASITDDPVLTAVLQEGRNLHVEMMVQVFGGEPDKHRREYTLSKNVNYGIEYGAGLDQITRFAAKAGYEPHEARRVAEIARSGHKRMFAKQHRMADWFAAKARELGSLPLAPEGRYRHFVGPGRIPKYYTALNALVQGGVAEFMKDTMIELYARGYGELLILQVHDELVFDVPANKGLDVELLAVLQSISHDINPFKYELTWEGKQWAA